MSLPTQDEAHKWCLMADEIAALEAERDEYEKRAKSAERHLMRLRASLEEIINLGEASHGPDAQAIARRALEGK